MKFGNVDTDTVKMLVNLISGKLFLLQCLPVLSVFLSRPFLSTITNLSLVTLLFLKRFFLLQLLHTLVKKFLYHAVIVLFMLFSIESDNNHLINYSRYIQQFYTHINFRKIAVKQMSRRKSR